MMQLLNNKETLTVQRAFEILHVFFLVLYTSQVGRQIALRMNYQCWEQRYSSILAAGYFDVLRAITIRQLNPELYCVYGMSTAHASISNNIRNWGKPADRTFYRASW